MWAATLHDDAASLRGRAGTSRVTPGERDELLKLAVALDDAARLLGDAVPAEDRPIAPAVARRSTPRGRSR